MSKKSEFEIRSLQIHQKLEKAFKSIQSVQLKKDCFWVLEYDQLDALSKAIDDLYDLHQDADYLFTEVFDEL